MILDRDRQNIAGNNKAFTLAELMIAVFIMALVLTSFLNAIVACSTLSTSSHNLSSAVASAQSKMEEIRNSEYSSIVTDFSDLTFSPDAPTNSTGTITVQEVGEDVAEDLLQVSIVVAWQNSNGRDVSTNLATLISNR